MGSALFSQDRMPEIARLVSRPPRNGNFFCILLFYKYFFKYWPV